VISSLSYLHVFPVHIHWCASVLRAWLTALPSSILQVDVFVTSAVPSSVLSAEEETLLRPPENWRSGEGSRDSNEHLIDKSGHMREYGDEIEDLYDLYQTDSPHSNVNYLDDLTRFDGDNDVALPGENALSRKVREIGESRRRKTLRRRMDGSKENGPNLKSTGESAATGARVLHSHDSTPSPPLLYPPSPLAIHSPGGRPFSTSTFGLLDIPQSKRASVNTSIISPVESIPASPSLSSFPASSRINQTQSPFSHLTKQERHDISFVSERVYEGRPKLEQILRDEVDRAEGSLIVACACSSLPF
jgi:hypothetical protein